MSNVVTTLRDLQQSLRTCDHSGLGEAGLRANELSRSGTGADAGATLLGLGDVSRVVGADPQREARL